MAALQDALKTLGVVNYADTPTDNLEPFLRDTFKSAQLIVDSVPISDHAGASTGRSRSNTESSVASSASEISLSGARPSPPPPDVEALGKEWKHVKLKPAENPLGISVYSTKGKDGKGTWFARRSIHEGLGFTKWKRALEREFPETLKVQGGPGEGNIRGIGGEKRVAYKYVKEVGKMEVYLLSAQFPGPTTPRDFVTMFISSDQALEGKNNEEVPRHFMVISKPCQHPDTPPREGYIRGQYESVEFIREIPIKKAPLRSASASNLAAQLHSRNRSESNLGKEAVMRNAMKNSEEGETGVTQSEGRSRGKTISFDKSRGSTAKGERMDIPSEDDESEQNPIEWIMVTRSDPGGSVPRFMVDRGTPAAIVSDAAKFLDWACSKTIEDLTSDDEEEPQDANENEGEGETKPRPHHHHRHDHEKDLHNYQTNGHLAGIETRSEDASASQPTTAANDGGIYDMMANAATAAGTVLAAHAPAVIADRIPQSSESSSAPETMRTRSRSQSLSSVSTESTVGSFASALSFHKTMSQHTAHESAGDQRLSIQEDKELQKLKDKKSKLEEKLEKARQKEAEKKVEDGEKEKEALRKVEEKHEKEVKKQQEKYRKEIEKLERKRQKEEMKRKKKLEKEKGEGLIKENEALRAELDVLKRESEVLKTQVGYVQRENTLLVGKIGKLGIAGEEIIKDVKEEMAGNVKGRVRSGSGRISLNRRSGSAERPTV